MIHGTRYSLFTYTYGISKGPSPISVISNKQAVTFWRDGEKLSDLQLYKGHGLIHLPGSVDVFLVKKTWFY